MNINHIQLLFLLTFMLISSTTLSQNKEIDSLENKLIVHTQKDTTRVNILDHLAFLYYRNNLEKAIEFQKKSEDLAIELDYKKGKGNSKYTKAVLEMVQSNFDVAIQYFEEAAQIYEENNLKRSLPGCYNGIGAIYSYKGDYETSTTYHLKALKYEEEYGVQRNIPNYITNIGINYMRTGRYSEATDNFTKALELYEEYDNTLGISNCLKNIAVIYQTQGNYPLALEYDNKALLLAKKMQDSSSIFGSYNNMGIIYKLQKRYDKALEVLEEALSIQEKLKNNQAIAATKNNIGTIYMRIEQNETAIKYLKESVEINREISAKSQLAESLNNLGYAYVSLKKYTEANKYYQEAKNINIEIENIDGLSYSYLGIADSFMEQKKYNEALPNALESLALSKELNLIEFRKEAHKVLAEIYEYNKDYKKALENHKNFKTFNDSLFNKENVEKTAELEYEYKYKQKLDSASIRELKLTKTVKSTSLDLEKSKQNYLWAIIGFLLLSIVLGSIIFYQKFSNIKSKNQNIVIEQKLLRSQMTPHFIFNSLSVLQGMILNKEENKSVTYLSKFSKLLRITLENSRDKMVSLSLELTAIENYLALQNLENKAYQHTVNVEDTIDVSLFEIPPMLIQPFVENAIEHAFGNQSENREIDVQLIYKNKRLICTVIDNGVGVNFQKENKREDKKSLATTITSERLKILSKDFKIEGSVTVEDRSKYNEKGTIVTIVIPHKILPT